MGRAFLLISLAALATLLLLAQRLPRQTDSGGRLAELGTLGTNRGERKLGREDPVNRNLPKNQAGHQENDPVKQNLPENVTGHQENRVRGSSSTGEISELSENSVGLSHSDE